MSPNHTSSVVHTPGRADAGDDGTYLYSRSTTAASCTARRRTAQRLRAARLRSATYIGRRCCPTQVYITARMRHHGVRAGEFSAPENELRSYTLSSPAISDEDLHPYTTVSCCDRERGMKHGKSKLTKIRRPFVGRPASQAVSVKEAGATSSRIACACLRACFQRERVSVIERFNLRISGWFPASWGAFVSFEPSFYLPGGLRWLAAIAARRQ